MKGLRVKSNSENTIKLNNVNVTLEEVFVKLEVIIPIKDDVLILRPFFYGDESYYENNPGDQIKTNISFKMTNNVGGKLFALKENEEQSISTALNYASNYFEELGYDVEVLND